jgi:hypothetical protein
MSNERPPLVGEVSANFCNWGCHMVSVTDPYCSILGFQDRSRYFFFQAAPQLYSRGWEDPVPNPLLLRKFSSHVWKCNSQKSGGISASGTQKLWTTKEQKVGTNLGNRNRPLLLMLAVEEKKMRLFQIDHSNLYTGWVHPVVLIHWSQ